MKQIEVVSYKVGYKQDFARLQNYMHWINDKLNEHFIHTIMKLLMLFIAMMFPIHTWLLSTKDNYSRPFDFESRQDIGLREKSQQT